MAIVDWETFFFGEDRATWIAIEVNDSTNAIRRAHWQVAAGVTAQLVIEDVGIDVTVVGPDSGSQNISGNHQLVMRDDGGGGGPYLSVPWDWSVRLMRNA